MHISFYITAAIAIVSALIAVTRKEAMHGILNLIVMLLAVAVLFFQMGAAFLGILEVIVYAGAIVVLFLFVIMMINPAADQQGFTLKGWFAPLVLTLALAIETFFLSQGSEQDLSLSSIDIALLGKTFFGKYIYTLHLVAVFLFVGLVGAFHLGKQAQNQSEENES